MGGGGRERGVVVRKRARAERAVVCVNKAAESEIDRSECELAPTGRGGYAGLYSTGQGPNRQAHIWHIISGISGKMISRLSVHGINRTRALRLTDSTYTHNTHIYTHRFQTPQSTLCPSAGCCCSRLSCCSSLPRVVLCCFAALHWTLDRWTDRWTE